MNTEHEDIEPATTTAGQVRRAIAHKKEADARLNDYLEEIRGDRPKTATERQTEALMADRGPSREARVILRRNRQQEREERDAREGRSVEKGSAL